MCNRTKIRRKSILYYGGMCTLFCDGKCDKAWGKSSRPTVTLSNGDEYWVSDSDFDVAPQDPGTYEGGYGKADFKNGREMNKWCARECERSVVVDKGENPPPKLLTDFSKRVLRERI